MYIYIVCVCQIYSLRIPMNHRLPMSHVPFPIEKNPPNHLPARTWHHRIGLVEISPEISPGCHGNFHQQPGKIGCCHGILYMIWVSLLNVEKRFFLRATCP